jgi:class 3 adenylate cyclase
VESSEWRGLRDIGARMTRTALGCKGVGCLPALAALNVPHSRSAALEAALAIHHAMDAGPWPDRIAVRLRIGLHRGRPALTDTGYVGLSVHAAARICFAAHGGQIVMSSAVRAGVADSLPDGVRLKSLGKWRFRGLPEPVELFQVAAPGLPADFPPLRAAVRAP